MPIVYPVQKTDAVRPDNAQQMGLCRRKGGLLQRAAPLTDLAETGGNDDGRTGTPLGQVADQTRHCLRRRNDDREARSLRQARNIPVNGQPIDFAVMRVDQHQLAGKPVMTQVAQDDPTDRAGPWGCADQRDRSWFEQPVEITNGHWPLSVTQASTLNAVLSSIGEADQRSESSLILSATNRNFTCVTLKSLK